VVRRQHLTAASVGNSRISSPPHFFRWTKDLFGETFRVNGVQSTILIVLFLTQMLMLLKVLLSTLIRNYTFELADGPETRIEHYMSALVRPMVAGEEGPHVPLVVRRVE
jgi:hypothetical protein